MKIKEAYILIIVLGVLFLDVMAQGDGGNEEAAVDKAVRRDRLQSASARRPDVNSEASEGSERRAPPKESSSAKVGAESAKSDDAKPAKSEAKHAAGDDAKSAKSEAKHAAGEDTKSAKSEAKHAAGDDAKSAKSEAGAEETGGLPNVRLADIRACAVVVRDVCSESILDSNFAVMDCLQSNQVVARRVPFACQHAIWQFKRNLTHNVKFDIAANGACKLDFERLTECQELKVGMGHRIACLIENQAKNLSIRCQDFLRRIEPIVFSDYRLIEPFVTGCRNDIERFRCGRFGVNPVNAADEVRQDLPDSQGRTIACLSRKVHELNRACKRQLLRLAELQAEDFHNDRQLYYACRDDRERLCANERAGDGRVLRCLSRQRHADRLSEKCIAELKRVHQLAMSDYGVEHRFKQQCAKDLRRYRCFEDVSQEDRNSEHGIVRAVLCLEKAIADDGQDAIGKDCQAEMIRVRTEFLTEPDLDPELENACKPQLKECHADHKTEHELLHCVIKQLMTAQAGDDAADSQREACKNVVHRILRIAMPTRDIRVDPVILSGCHAELSTHCANANAYACLKRLAAGRPNEIGRACADRVAELQYFEIRDFKLSDTIYRACKKSAREACNAKDDWFKLDTKDGYQPAATVYNCLFHHVHHTKNMSGVSRVCAGELLGSLRERANRVQLDPRLYADCITDLATTCKEKEGVGKEFRCLQDNLESLSERCRAAVTTLTQEESKSPQLSPDVVMVRACMPFVERFCSEDAQGDKSAGLEEPGEVMECLIKHLNHPSMHEKCAAGVKHHQLIALKDYRFSYAFAEACKGDIYKLCAAARNKSAVVSCLSQSVHNDTMMDKQQRVSARCRQKLTLQVLQRSDNVKLDPRLVKHCGADLEKCKEDDDKLNCLHRHSSDLEPDCSNFLFKRQQLRMDMPTYDAKLLRRCRGMIQLHCKEVADDPKELFGCLRQSMHLENFNKRCRRVIYRRMRVQQGDYRLNPELNRNCGSDVKKYCRKELKQLRESPASSDGQVMRCLRKTMTSASGDGLTPRCYRHVRGLLVEYNLNYRLDPQLRRHCGEFIKRKCPSEIQEVSDEGEGLGRVNDCLKHQLMQGSLQASKYPDCHRDVLNMLSEIKADIHLDPVLYKRCSFEIEKFCDGVALGNGRRMSCAIGMFNDPLTRGALSQACRSALNDRIELMNAVFKRSPETVQEVVGQMAASPARNYFFTVLLALAALLLLVGVCTGRVTKRVKVDMKNR